MRINFVPAQPPVVWFSRIEVRRPGRHDEVALAHARRRKIGVLEPAIAHELCVQTAVTRMVNLLIEDAVEARRNRSAGFRRVDDDAARGERSGRGGWRLRQTEARNEDIPRGRDGQCGKDAMGHRVIVGREAGRLTTPRRLLWLEPPSRITASWENSARAVWVS